MMGKNNKMGLKKIWRIQPENGRANNRGKMTKLADILCGNYYYTD